MEGQTAVTDTIEKPINSEAAAIAAEHSDTIAALNRAFTKAGRPAIGLRELDEALAHVERRERIVLIAALLNAKLIHITAHGHQAGISRGEAWPL